ncbi:MAG: hypothetical protein JSV26_08240 [bacterium]|nr:MAG: hypothetical protein JSV26_08240 [bacterium]
MRYRSWLCALLAAAILGTVSCRTVSKGDIAYLIKHPRSHRDITISFSYDEERERNILQRIGWQGRIIIWQIECTNRYFFFRPFQFTQGDLITRPVLCLVRKYLCDDKTPEEGYVFQGYLYLDERYDLSRPITITLADRVIRVVFRT